ncbi:hypothetical protein F5Y09DRAFT_325064 [Xylaria sp. FL1042]|nr:hypothetical protein F5Y09DRAFT_325064 [Xylaria sp. FL1042]
MPRKVRPPADAAQNRENQQRLRARRRAYLEDLEARVRGFEARDMRATLEMQRAAREVAWANERLVELLAMMGVSRGEVDEFLRRCREEDRNWGAATGANPGLGSSKESVAGVVNMRRTTTSQIKSVPVGLEGGDERGDVVVVVPDAPRRSTEMGDGDSSQALVTSCDAAASIIADFQGHGDVSRARMALGCDETANCHVKNTRLFQLMDAPGGA